MSTTKTTRSIKAEDAETRPSFQIVVGSDVYDCHVKHVRGIGWTGHVGGVTIEPQTSLADAMSELTRIVARRF